MINSNFLILILHTVVCKICGTVFLLSLSSDLFLRIIIVT